MTIQELIIKLEECRSNMEGIKDDIAKDTHDTLNQLIYDIETDGLEGNEYYSSGRNRGMY